MFFKACIVSLLVLTVSGNPDFKFNFTESNAFAYLEQFGYVNKSKDTFNSDLPTRPGREPETPGRVFRESLEKFQESAGLQITGELDDSTIELMQAPRCGLGFVEEARLTTPKWNKKTLSYRVVKYSRWVSRTDVDRTVRKAMDFWEAEADIKFVKSSGRADIEIKFGSGEHGDGLSFDGPGGVLAHAYYPSRSAIGGDAHFDDDENWSVTDYIGKQLLQTTTHELGHSLGLSHSKVRGSVMFFSYPGWNPAMKLHRDDADRIRNLYGPSVAKAPGGGSCVCQDFTRIDKRTGVSVGNCRTEYKGRMWCYLDSESTCSDAQRSSKVNKEWSWEACEDKQSVKGSQGGDCECNGITRNDAGTDKTVGHCLTQYLGSYWCYISADSQCPDKKGTKRNKDGLRFWSAQGCQSKERLQQHSQKPENSKVVFPDQEILEYDMP